MGLQCGRLHPHRAQTYTYIQMRRRLLAVEHAGGLLATSIVAGGIRKGVNCMEGVITYSSGMHGFGISYKESESIVTIQQWWR